MFFRRPTTLDLVCVHGSVPMSDGIKTALRAPSAHLAYHGQSLLGSVGGAPPPSGDHQGVAQRSRASSFAVVMRSTQPTAHFLSRNSLTCKISLEVKW